MSYYIFRICYESDDSYTKLRTCIIKNNELRQGWGAKGMDLQNQDDFIKAWPKDWGSDADYILRKYRNLSIMLEMKEYDRIIIPKLSFNHKNGNNFFVIAELDKTGYTFSPLENDFGHTIHIRPIVKSCSYAHNGDSRTISGKFKAYRRAINRVYDENFISAVEHLIEQSKLKPNDFSKDDQSPIEALTDSTREKRQAYLSDLVDKINQWQPNQLERVVEELFSKNGYVITKKNHYDSKGGDIDLIIRAFPSKTLMSDIFCLSSDGSFIPEIHIQVKNKKGHDYDDTNGIDQLVNMDVNCNNNINILINTTKTFSDKAKKRADQKGVTLINGTEFAALLVKYGLDIK